MRMELNRFPKPPSWPKTVVRKWLNLKSGANEFHSDCYGPGRVQGGRHPRRKSCSDEDASLARGDLSGSGWSTEMPGNLESETKLLSSGPTALSPLSYSSPPPSHDLRVFVGTWNVGGTPPHGGLDIREWLRPAAAGAAADVNAAADVYVLGFQEIVPLNAGNVLGAEDVGPARRWLALIRHALNQVPAGSDPVRPRTPTEDPNPNGQPRVSFSDLLSCHVDDGEGEEDEQESSACVYPAPAGSGHDSPEMMQSATSAAGGKGYCLVASRQMVGVFLCVWVRSELMRHVRGVRVSCVGRGIMGYMGNKGSVSISMTLKQSTFCFVCTHLTSGEKVGDEVRRNLDVSEILKRTKFPRPWKCYTSPAVVLPDTILEHDKIIWLGDLNYRLSAGCSDIPELLNKGDWESLLEKDQLRKEQSAGHVFNGWEEGRIYFPPTYKYIANTDCYAVNHAKSAHKRRTPAWCDRILWRGEGIKQTWYVRGESQFSDHRPVCSLFLVHFLEGRHPWQPEPNVDIDLYVR